MRQRCHDSPDLCFRARQIFFVHQFALNELGFEITIGSLERAFDDLRAAVKRVSRNALEPPKSCCADNSLPDDSEADILACIQHQAENSHPSPRTDISHSRFNKFDRIITRGWVYSFLIRKKGDLTEMMSDRQENTWVQPHLEYLVATICDMEEAIQGSICDFLMIMATGGQIIHHGVNGEVNHITVITSMVASGERLIPYAITW
jgi:hypothetical protein